MVDKTSEFFEYDQLSKKHYKGVLIIDYYNLAYRCLFTSQKFSDTNIKKSKDQEELNMQVKRKQEFYWFKYYLVNQFREMLMKFKPERVVVALDSRKTWRKEYYPLYKAQRKAIRDKSAVDFEAFFNVFRDFTEELKQLFTSMIFMDIDGAEADDIVAVLARDVLKDVQDVTCVTSDGDMHQLLNLRNFFLYEPIKKKMVQSISPKNNLIMKILMGDKGDNIPSVKPRMGKVTASSVVSKGTLAEFFSLNTQEVKENFERNKVLIDFTHIPFDIKDKIKESYESVVTKKVDGKLLYKFFIKQKMPNFLEDTENYLAMLNTLE